MTQENKELLLRDLCTRLPYGVRIAYRYNYILELRAVLKIGMVLGANVITDECITTSIENVIPYLFPLSSMTEEQKYDFYCHFIENDCDFGDFKEFYFENNEWHKMLTSIDDCECVIDWFNKNHFDYRCLIPKGLAIDATNLNIY